MARGEIKLDGRKYDLKDMKNWFIQIRGFPSILSFGRGRSNIMGEGQMGGRAVSEVAHRAESEFVKKLGEKEYTRRMDLLMKKGGK